MATATLADLPMAAPAAGAADESARSAPSSDWKQQTVGEFFANCNWENLEAPVLAVTAGADPAIAFDYSHSVSQFFSAIPWAGGAAVISASPAQEAGAVEVLPGSEQSSQGEPSIEELPDLAEIADESHLDGGDVTLDDFLGSFSL